MPLDIQMAKDKLKGLYQPNTTKAYNLMVYGQAGTGKTSLVRTCPKPILIHSFDPNGCSVLGNLVDGKNIIVDRRFEGATGSRVRLRGKETPFTAWEREFNELAASGIFEAIGTLVIDSATTWASLLMDEVIKKDKRRLTCGWVVGRNETPDQKDWQIQMTAITLALWDFISLPCNCLLICHETMDKDELVGSLHVQPLLTGKLKEQIPPIFDEVYRSIVRHIDGKEEYMLLTRNDGMYMAKSRLSGIPPKLDKFEKADIKALMRKVGLSAEDKPSL